MEPVRIGKYLRVMRIPLLESGKTCFWQVYANDDELLGYIEWSTGWRQYTFHPEELSYYSAGCMQDIACFMDANRDTRTTTEAPPCS